MAVQNLCDGTGVAIPEDTPTTGVFSRQYCDAARPDAEAYLAERDEIHTRHAISFAADLEKLRAKYRERLQTLPDDAP